jgi:N,N'-diacetyl-8-epilegionaminate cytidylyltransferase
MSIIAFVFARGGSKGLPGKNIKPLCGKPLLHYSIEIAQQIPEISAVYVSTDCDHIAASAIQAGALVIKRPADLASDTAAEWLAWQHAILQVQQSGIQFDTFVSLPATSPLRAVQDVTAALARLKTTAADICIGVTPAARNPYFNMVKPKGADEVCLFNNEQMQIKRRQDAPVAFDITTVVYAARVNYILENNALFSGKVTSIEVPKQRAVDIDDLYDFLFAESLLKSGATFDV